MLIPLIFSYMQEAPVIQAEYLVDLTVVEREIHTMEAVVPPIFVLEQTHYMQE